MRPLEFFTPAEFTERRARPLFLTSVSAGSPSPTDADVDAHVDLNERVLRNPETTYYVTAIGQSMTEAGIDEGDLLVVDRSLVEHAEWHVVIAITSEGSTIKRLSRIDGALWLVPETTHRGFRARPVDGETLIWGVVTFVLKSLDEKCPQRSQPPGTDERSRRIRKP